MKSIKLSLIGFLALGLMVSIIGCKNNDEVAPCNNTANLVVVNKTTFEWDLYVENQFKQNFKSYNESHIITIPSGGKVNFKLIQKIAIAGVTRTAFQDNVEGCGLYTYAIQ